MDEHSSITSLEMGFVFICIVVRANILWEGGWRSIKAVEGETADRAKLYYGSKKA